MKKAIRVVNLSSDTQSLIIKLPNGDIIDITKFGGRDYYVDHREGVNSDSFGAIHIKDGAVS